MTTRTNSNQSLDESTAGAMFLAVTVALLLMAVALSLGQKRWESQVGIGIATQVPTGELTDLIENARTAQVISLSIAALSIVIWCMGFYRREANRLLQSMVPILLTLFLVMQLLLV